MVSSNYQILEQKKSAKRLKTVAKNVIPISIEWKRNAKQAWIKLSDGREVLGSCIHCINPPCMEYSESEIDLETFQEFPSDRNMEVCPTKAINWPQDSDSPTIDSEACIFCGICVSRCPVAAIYLDPDMNTAVLNDQPNEYFLLENEEVSEATQNPLLQVFSRIRKNGVFIFENENTLQRFFDKFRLVAPRQSAQFPNHLVRNLMIEVGISASMRRRGDANIRMDIVFGQNGKKNGTCEVELGNGVLDAPRNLLDNIAVLISRYKMNKGNLIPLVATLSLPNRRSEYWQVIKDIRHVLGIKINSITVGMLVLLVWNRVKVSFDSDEILYADSSLYTLKDKFESVLGRELNFKEGYPGLLGSQK